MTSQQEMFEEENIFKALMGFAIPGVITILVSELYNMVDTFFVGKYVGPNAVGALGIAFPVQRLIIASSLLIGVGTSTMVARSLGEKNYKRVNANIANAILLGLIVSIIIPIFIFLFRKNIITILGASKVIYPLAEQYINIILLGSLFLSFTNIFGYCLIALGDPRVTVKALSIGTLANVIINFILVGRLNIGIKGAAIATVVSQFLGFTYALYKMIGHGKKINLKFKNTLNFSIWKTIVSIGFATFVVEISDAIVIGLLNNLLLPYGGDLAIIIVGAITRVSMFMYITIIGISSGMQPLVSYNYGAKNKEKLKRIVKETVKLVSGTSIVLWALAMIFTKQIFSGFITDPDVLIETVKAFRLTIVVFPVISIYYISIYYNQAINEAKASFFLSIYRQLLLFIPIVIILVNLMGLKGAWLTYPITDVISAVTGFYFIKKSLAN